jgi:hypothetical protein
VARCLAEGNVTRELGGSRTTAEVGSAVLDALR